VMRATQATIAGGDFMPATVG